MRLKQLSKLIIQQLLKGNFAAAGFFKYYDRWVNSLLPGHNSLQDRLPWLTFPAIDVLLKNTDKSKSVFEFGGGGSTLFFLDRAREVVTVEHDPEWFGYLQKDIALAGNNNWTPLLKLPELTENAAALDYKNPDHYYSADEQYKQYRFYNYASAIDQFADGYFDVVLIDGRARASCLKHAVKKVKKGGLLIMDNAERSYYLANDYIASNHFKLLINSMAPVPFINFFSQTNIWVKQ